VRIARVETKAQPVEKGVAQRRGAHTVERFDSSLLAAHRWSNSKASLGLKLDAAEKSVREAERSVALR
jgi:hypothetical protein